MTQKDVSSSQWPTRSVVDDSALEALRDLSRTVTLLQRNGRWSLSDETIGGEHHAVAPPCSPEDLGDATFCRDVGIRYPYLSGSMANGIGSVEIVEAMGGAGLVGFFGAAGLSLAAIEKAIDRLETTLAGRPFGFNLIHTPNEPEIEKAVVDLYIRRRVRQANSGLRDSRANASGTARTKPITVAIATNSTVSTAPSRKRPPYSERISSIASGPPHATRSSPFGPRQDDIRERREDQIDGRGNGEENERLAGGLSRHPDLAHQLVEGDDRSQRSVLEQHQPQIA